MKSVPNSSSRWRIELSHELALYYAAHPDIKIIVLGGSAARGEADRYSDLDIIVYWDKVDVEWLERMPLHTIEVERAYMRPMGEGVYLESYYFGALKVDFGHITLEDWGKWTDTVLEDHQTDGGMQKSLDGFLNSVTLHGEELVASWKERLGIYPEPLAVKIVRENLGFYVRGYLVNQCLKRGDLLAFHTGIDWTLKKVLAILAAINRVYFNKEEPRWLESELRRMPIKPVDTWPRIRTILEAQDETAVPVLESLILDTIDLIEEHLPEVDTSRSRMWVDLAVEGCDTKPEIKLR